MSLDTDSSKISDLNEKQDLNITVAWKTDTDFWCSPEVNDLYESTQESVQKLNKELEARDRQRKEKVYKGLNFWYVQWDISNMRSKMADLYDKDSLEWILFNNSQIQNFFSIALSEQEKDWNRVNKEYEEKKSKELNWDEQDQEVWEDIEESWEEYSLRETSPENFEKFLLSETWLKILREEIDDHIDPNWNIYKNYPISKKVLQLKLRKAWFNTIREEYNKKYNIIMDNDKINIKKYWNIITHGVDVAVWDYLKSWGNARGDWLAWRLELLLLNENGGDIRLDMQEESVDLDDFKVFLKESIKKYANIILKRRKEWEKVQLSTWETQLDLQLKAYLFIYGKFFYPQDFKVSWELLSYNENLLDIFEAILYFDGKLETVQDNKYIELERKAELARLERDKQRRKTIAERNRERNNRLRSAPKMEKWFNIDESQAKSLDPNNATWSEIAANADLDLKDYNLDIKESEENEQRSKEAIFRDAYNNFITSRNNIKEYITIEQMRRIFDINNNTINNIEWEKFKEFNPLLKEMSQDEVATIYNALLWFSTYFTGAQKRLSSNYSELREKVGDTVKTHAIGAVIDNVRDTFSIITEKQSWNSKWFQLDKNNPVKKDWNDIIISGLFNGSDVEIRYNLETWDLLMKSLLHKDEIDPNKISIWEGYDKIWTLEPFNNVLNNYYKLPPRPTNNDRVNDWSKPWMGPWGGPINQHKEPPQKGMENNTVLPPNMTPHQVPMWSPMPRIDRNNVNHRREEAKKLLNSQINLTNETTKNKTESMAQINLAISKFMKTFNIMPNSLWSTSLDFNKWSNLFDIIQIIDNTGNIETGDIQSLGYFSNEFMPKIIEYSWLKWGERNEYQNKTTKRSEKLFGYNGDNEGIKYLRYMIKDFNPTQFSWTSNFENSHQLWLANFIKETVIIWSSPNWRLNTWKMEEFINNLEAEFDNKVEEDPNIELDKELAKQLSNI